MASIIRRKYKVTLPNGKIVTRKCQSYTIEYTDPATGKRKRASGYKDKGATLQLAARLERQLARGEEGLLDPFREHKGRPIAEHVADYVADLRAAGRDEMYVAIMEKRLAKLVKGCGWATLPDINANSFVKWREQESREHVAPGRMGKGASAATLNQYLDTGHAFTNWCAQMGRMTGVPVGRKTVATALAGVGKVTGEKRRLRRALTDEQVGHLLAVAGERAIIYRMGLAIGLRRAEFEALQWGDLHLNAIRPYVQLRAEATKARRGDRLDFPQTLADDLRGIRPKNAKDSQQVFPSVPPIEQWRADLAAAGIAYKDDQGRQADFHGLRKTMCSRMHKAGVPLAVATRRMRHIDPKLTMFDYADDQQIGMEAGVLPELPAAPVATPAKTAQA